MYAYIGSKTTRERNARGKGISVYKITEDNFKKIQTIKIYDNPSYLCFDINKEYLYAVHGDYTKVSSYKINEDGTLTFLNIIDISLKNPVFIEVDKENKKLVVATLQGGALISISLNKDMSLGKIYDKYDFKGREINTRSFAHQCLFDKNKEYIFVPTQARKEGYERLNLFKYNNGKFELKYYFDAREYSEPRHVAITTDNNRVYLSNEKSNEVTYLKFDSNGEKIKAFQSIKTIPDTYVGKTDVAAVLIDKNDEFLVVSNRYSDILTTYRIDDNTGYLSLISFTNNLGKTPRFMTFVDNTNTLYVANEDSDAVFIYQLNSDGFLKYSGKSFKEQSPVCIIFKGEEI